MTTNDPLTSPYGFRVDAELEAVPEARRRIVALVRAWDVDLSEDALGDLELLSTELITNAVRYTQAPCSVVVRWTGLRVRVEVADVDPVRPQPRHGSLEAGGGRGLLLVESLATAWGSAADPAGKVVWCEVGPPDAAVPAENGRLAARVRAALRFSSSGRRPAHRRRLLSVLPIRSSHAARTLTDHPINIRTAR
ncbi:ATP-binding protein [Streptomyces polygonati]|uniref:ATP-binding protein n=1 Tax=Streptomyces polygonati TaxID=1617087 RepID=A0ABV8I2R2_9ACTN